MQRTHLCTVLLVVLSASSMSSGQKTYFISNVAGTGVTSTNVGDSGQGTSASLNQPYDITLDSTNSNMYISDSANYRVRKLSLSTGIITTFAGTGTKGSSGDGGYAASASFNEVYGIVFDNTNTYLYISDYGNFVIRRVLMSTNIISLYAGTPGSYGSSGDGGAATNAKFYYAHTMAFDSSNNVYVADYGNFKVRKITSASSIVSTFAGSGSLGSSGDGGLATSAALSSPRGIAIDKTSTYLYISDTENYRLRRVSLATNIITAFAGIGTLGFSGDDGAAMNAKLSYPEGMAFDSSGNLYFGDGCDVSSSNNHRVRKVEISTSIITTFAGTGMTTYIDNTYATAAGLNAPRNVAIDSNDNVFITEWDGNRIRKVTWYTPAPTRLPTRLPTAVPTRTPTRTPTAIPTVTPTAVPTRTPTRTPTAIPTASPTSAPTFRPSFKPSSQPTSTPSSQPSSSPTNPTSQPSKQPSAQPSSQPSAQPSAQPSRQPSSQPSRQPSSRPSCQPTFQP